MEKLPLNLNVFQNQRLRETIFDMNEQKLHVHRLLEEQGAPVSVIQSVAKINTVAGNVIYFYFAGVVYCICRQAMIFMSKLSDFPSIW